ncbi:conjugal transfer nickase/helicase TraI [Aeromonas salmonicida]|nr:conjugal transfer nickase/helicase TraI [Aeromonas salmonicida]
MTIKDNEGKVRLISNIENTAHDLAIYQPREIKVSEGDRSASPAPSMNTAM